MTENEALKIFENEVVILDCWIENDKDIIANCDMEDDEFDDDKELAELSLKDYSERKELFETAISAFKEIQQYREIGTVEECRKAIEKQKPKLPDIYTDTRQRAYGSVLVDIYECPNCGSYLSDFANEPDSFCSNCGQAIETKGLAGVEE